MTPKQYRAEQRALRRKIERFWLQYSQGCYSMAPSLRMLGRQYRAAAKLAAVALDLRDSLYWQREDVTGKWAGQ